MHNKSGYGRTGRICYNKITVKCYKNVNIKAKLQKGGYRK